MLHKDFNISDGGMLLRIAASSSKPGVITAQAVVPVTLRAVVMQAAHDDATALHAGIAATQMRIMEKYWWHTLGGDVRAYVNSCLVCQKRKSSNSTNVREVIRREPRIWETLAIDLLDMHVVSEDGMRYVCVMTEFSTSYVFLFALPSKEAAGVAECVFQVFLEAGAPEILLSDQGTEFANEVVYHLCRLFEVRKVQTSGYHPKANGKVEKCNVRVSEALYAHLGMSPQGTWPRGLPMVQFAMRTTPHTATGITPFFMMFGREAKVPSNATIDKHLQDYSFHEIVQRKLQHLRQAKAIVNEKWGINKERVDKNNANLKREVKFTIDGYVWVVQQPVRGLAHKLHPHYSGLWKLIATGGGVPDEETVT